MATRGRPRKTRTLADVPSPQGEMAEVLAAIRKRHGDRSVVSGNDIRQPWRIPTGVFTFDYATLGGIPHNRITQFDGAKHSGKTTMSLRCIRGAQISLPDQQAVLLDVEGTYDATWGGKIGVDNDQLLVVQPNTGEEAVDMAVGLAHAKETSLIVVDSLAALLPIKEEEASAEDSLVGLQSRMITSMLRKLTGAMNKERKRDHFVTILLINQQRSKIGGYAPAGVEPLSNPGGKAVGYFTSLEARFKNKENLKERQGIKVTSHNEHSFSIGKNKMNGGMRAGEFQMMRMHDPDTGLNEGDVDDAETMLAFAKHQGMLEGGGRAGQTLTIGDDEWKFASTAEAVRYLYDNREIYDVLRASLIATHAQNLGMPEYFVNYLLGVTE